MLKIYICPQCGWIRLVSRRSTVECFKCNGQEMKLTNLNISRYQHMSEKEREDYSKGWLYIHAKNK